MTVQSGFLVAADVTGYTEFLTGSELVHSQDIMRGLMKVLTRSLGHPLHIIKYEGDAVLCHAPDAAFKNTPLLLDVLESTYVAFSDHVFNMKTCTTGECTACGKIKALDLKVFVHHGNYVLEHGAKGLDLAGPDVILLHRLMKNSVKEATGRRAYVLATAQALEQLGSPNEFTTHLEHYEHFGDVACGVADLHALLDARRAQRDVRVTAMDAQAIAEGIVAASPSAVWDYYFDPDKRLRWDNSHERDALMPADDQRPASSPSTTVFLALSEPADFCAISPIGMAKTSRGFTPGSGRASGATPLFES